MRWPTLILPVVVALLVAACSKVTQENYLKIEEGMTEEEVNAVLGKPSETNSVNVLGVSGTVSRWAGREGVITVRFINGRAGIKSFDKPASK